MKASNRLTSKNSEMQQVKEEIADFIGADLSFPSESHKDAIPQRKQLQFSLFPGVSGGLNRE